MLNHSEVSHSSNGRFLGLMREKVVHTSSESSVLLAGKVVEWAQWTLAQQTTA